MPAFVRPLTAKAPTPQRGCVARPEIGKTQATGVPEKGRA
jgi:hypothetical protein